MVGLCQFVSRTYQDHLHSLDRALKDLSSQRFKAVKDSPSPKYRVEISSRLTWPRNVIISSLYVYRQLVSFVSSQGFQVFFLFYRHSTILYIHRRSENKEGRNINSPYNQNAANTGIMRSPFSDLVKNVIAIVIQIHAKPWVLVLRRGVENLSW